jgi:hypothetical protein
MQPIFQREVPNAWPTIHFIKRLVLGGGIALGVASVAIRPRTMCHFPESKADIATATVKKYALEAYPSWSLAHPDRACPRSLLELGEYMSNHDTFDPWGRPYYFACGARAIPRSADDVWVLSAGEDGVFGTADDIRSDR